MSKNLQFVIFGIVIMVAGQYYDSPIGLIGLALLLWPAIAWFWKSIGGGDGESQLDKWSKQLPETKYKHASGDHGIALDETARELHLFIYGIEKTYPFADIRKWEAVISTGGKFLTGKIAALDMSLEGRANRRIESENQDETGFFISVRDIDTPVWRIRFSEDQHVEKRLHQQWMEIFRQVVKGE